MMWIYLKATNINEHWETFKQQLGFHFIAIEKEDASSRVKLGTMMGVAGPDAQAVYNTFREKLITTSKDKDGKEVVDDKSKDFIEVVKKFDEYAAEKKCLLGCSRTGGKRVVKVFPRGSLICAIW